jgi:hypothetical protein
LSIKNPVAAEAIVTRYAHARLTTLSVFPFPAGASVAALVTRLVRRPGLRAVGNPRTFGT